MRRPVSISSIAKGRGSRWGRRSTPPESATMPSLTSGRANSAVSLASIRSAASASSKPPPMARPLTAAITGLPKLKNSVKPPKPPGPWWASMASPSVAPAKSHPAEKKRPVPVRMATRKLGSSCSLANAAYSARLVGTLMALALGRFRVMVSTPSSAWVWTASSSASVMGVPCKQMSASTASTPRGMTSTGFTSSSSSASAWCSA